MHTLSSAARAVGVAKSRIYRAVKAGRLSAYKLTSGTYAICPGELRRAFLSIPSSTQERERGSLDFPAWDVS
jgi:hypothetical protein